MALFNFNTSLISAPNGVSWGMIIKPWTGSSPAIPSSSSEQNIPLDTSPLNLPFLILVPSAKVDPWRATGTISCSFMLFAAVTIWILSVPISTWQILSFSASGCFTIWVIFPVTTLSIVSPWTINSSSCDPVKVNLSPNSLGLTFIST